MIKKTIFVCFYLLFLLNTTQAQYVNTDSLHVLDGSPFPVSIAELDSIEMYSPEIRPDYFSGGPITSGYLLSQFSLPAKGKVISRFGPRSGRMHTGTDIKLNKGDTVYAAYDGQVTMSKYYYGYGNLVVIDHGNNIETYYSHLSKCLVNTSRFVRMGDAIGLAGATGRATTTHLHFEVRENNRPYDAELVFDFENGRIRNEVVAMENLASLHKELKPKGYSVNQPVSQKYVVRPGDSLYKIARYTKTTIQALCMLNNLTESSILQIGQVLHIY
jgi:murein DD-endopeptidase MepM/ murein hydrolase activator NlpD